MNRKPTQQSSLTLTRSLLAGAVALSLALGGMAVASAQPTGSDQPCVERGAPWGDKGRSESRQNLDQEQRQALREQREERRQAWNDMDEDERQALRERKQERRAAWEAKSPEERREMRERLRDMDPEARREWFQQQRG
jgi:Spy/CpxP family protein refolding chaperone